MAKELVIYKNTKVTGKKSKIAKGNIFAKASREQKFLGKTLPKMAWGVAKWGWKHPIASTVLTIAGGKMLKQRPGLKFPKYRQYDKRGRKII